MEKKIKDIAMQVHRQQVGEHLATLSSTIRTLSGDIGVRTARSNASLAYINLANRTATELDRLAGFYPDNIEGVAWCSRKIFEINLVVRHKSRANENMS